MIAPKDCNEYTLVRLKNEKNNDLIRAYYTRTPVEILKFYKYMEENEIDIDIDPDGDCGYGKQYDDMIGSIEYITVGFGGKVTFPYIDIHVSVRDYR